MSSLWIAAASAVLLASCNLGTGLRDASANRFSPSLAPPPTRQCASITAPTVLENIPLPNSRQVAASDWVSTSGGIVVISDRGDRFKNQSLFVASVARVLTPLPAPAGLKSPIDEVRLVPGSRELIILGEAWSSGQAYHQSLLNELRGVPYHGDLVVTDASGGVLARHRSAHHPIPSPNFQSLAYWRSNFNGLHNLFISRPTEPDEVFVCSVTEADPGSGESFGACWSEDSRYLYVQGSAEHFVHLSWTYDTSSRTLSRDAG